MWRQRASRDPQFDTGDPGREQYAGRFACGAAGRQHVVDECEAQASESRARRRAKRARDVAGPRGAAQMALLGGGAAALERAGGERQPEAACGMAADDGGLVEAALEIAGAVQRHRHHDVGQRHGVRRALAGDQHAEQPAAGGVAVELERAHAMIDRVVVTVGRHHQRPGRRAAGGPALERAAARGQLAVAVDAQVERAAHAIDTPGGATQRAGGGHAEPLETREPTPNCRPAGRDLVDSRQEPREHAASVAAGLAPVAPSIRPVCREMQ